MQYRAPIRRIQTGRRTAPIRNITLTLDASGYAVLRRAAMGTRFPWKFERDLQTGSVLVQTRNTKRTLCAIKELFPSAAPVVSIPDGYFL